VEGKCQETLLDSGCDTTLCYSRRQKWSFLVFFCEKGNGRVGRRFDGHADIRHNEILPCVVVADRNDRS